MSQPKYFLMKVLTIPIINYVLRLFLYPVKSLIPTKYLTRIPIIGKVSVKYNNIDELILITDGRDSIATQIYWRGAYAFESDEIKVYMSFLENMHTLLDIGANTGIYSLIAAKHPTPQEIYAFEPMPTIAEGLRENVVANNLNNIHIHEIALTDSNGEIELHIPIQPTLPTGSSTNASFRKNTQAISVQAMTLDSFIANNQIEKVDFMKIDTESTEPAVLRGGKELIERDRPIIMCEVLLKRVVSEIEQVFDGQDYQVYRIESSGIRKIEHIEVDLNATNYLFVPIEKISLIPSHIMF